jgi:bifunctional N-acetylglucosamine-1-phosphate-uridyltransferase/glucosamine-1-phosphate-acetyltransferase GlmU-like protein
MPAASPFARITALVLAAGRGTRMRSPLPKPLVPLAGRPLVAHLLDAIQEAGISRTVLVVGHGAELVREALGPGHAWALQEPQFGMAHAVEVARDAVGDAPLVFVSVGDSPLLRAETIRRLLHHHLETRAACSFLTALFPEPPPYARVIRDGEGRLRACVEERDASPEEREVRELLSSHYLFEAESLWSGLPGIRPHPVTGERYLTDILALLLARGARVAPLCVDDWRELVGLNTPEELAWAEGLLAGRGGRT